MSRKLKLAQKYLNEMQYGQAILIFDEVIAVEPKTMPAYIGKVNAYAAVEDIANAVDTMKTAVKTANA